MCKILIIPHINADRIENLWKFVTHAVQPLSEKDGDGFGYMALDNKGNIFSEKWVSPRDAFYTQSGVKKVEDEIVSAYRGILSIPERYKRIGIINAENVSSIALHARKATCGVSIKNTHPFITKDKTTALIHNGVVDTENLELKNSSCDSEGILNAYVKYNVGDDINGMKELARNVHGQYACGVYALTAQGFWVLDIIKDDAARLSAVYVEELNSIVFCTDTSIVTAVCRKLKWKISAKFNLKDNYLIRHDPFTGKVLDLIDFVPTKREKFTKEVWSKGNLNPYDKYDNGYGV